MGMLGQCLVLTTAVVVVVHSFQFGEVALPRVKRQAAGRSNVQGCTFSPAGIDNPLTPAREGVVLTINCNTDKAYDVCAFQHTQPMDVGMSTQTANTDIGTKCVMSGQSSNGQSCPDDSRITYVNSATQCGIRIGRSEPIDTGKWQITVGEFTTSGSVPMNSKTVTVYTFNRTIPILQDDREIVINRDMEIWYNYDDNKDTWRAGSGGWQNVKMTCNAKGGRPEPTVRWLINNDDRSAFGDLENNAEADRVFDVRDSLGSTYDVEGYIRDKLSRLTFDVNREFLSYLWTKHQLDTNPTSGIFSFDLTCEVQQADYATERTTIRINVRREYFKNALKGETIGMIVGIVLAVVLVVFVVLLLLFARATGRWCFADDEYGYQDPMDPKRRPRTQAQR